MKYFEGIREWIANFAVKYSSAYQQKEEALNSANNKIKDLTSRLTNLDSEFGKVSAIRKDLDNVKREYAQLEERYQLSQNSLTEMHTRLGALAGELEVSRAQLIPLGQERDKYRSDLEKKEGHISHLQYQQRVTRRRLREMINAYPRAVLMLDSSGKVYAQNVKSRELLGSQKCQDFTGRLDLKNHKKQEVQIGDHTYSCKTYSLGTEEGYRVEVKKHFFQKKAKPKPKPEKPKPQISDDEMKSRISEIEKEITNFCDARGLIPDNPQS